MCTNVSSDIYPNWSFVLAQGVCTGVGSEIIYSIHVGLATTYFGQRGALAIAIVTTGNSYCGALYPFDISVNILRATKVARDRESNLPVQAFQDQIITDQPRISFVYTYRFTRRPYWTSCSTEVIFFTDR
jgi:hypothetical protein